jgi:hypothetical protein
VRQSLAPEALKAHELQLTPKCIAHNLTTGAACFCEGSFDPRWPWKASVQAGPHHQRDRRFCSRHDNPVIRWTAHQEGCVELRRNQPLGIEVIAKAIEPFDASQREREW